MESYLPDLSFLILWLIFTEVRFENQRWVRARMGGLRGASELAGAFVDLTGLVGLLYAAIFLMAYWYDHGFASAAVLLLLGTFLPLIWTAVIRDGLVIWIIATVAVWPMMWLIRSEVTWFGFF
jgi:hypothetical protein